MRQCCGNCRLCPRCCLGATLQAQLSCPADSSPWEFQRLELDFSKLFLSLPQSKSCYLSSDESSPDPVGSPHLHQVTCTPVPGDPVSLLLSSVELGLTPPASLGMWFHCLLTGSSLSGGRVLLCKLRGDINQAWAWPHTCLM